MTVFSKLVTVCFFLCCLPRLTNAEVPASKTQTAATEWRREKPISLIAADRLSGWTKTQFGSEAEVLVENGELLLEMGSPLTGVTISEEAMKKLPRINYEITLQARRELGSDFFVGLTFPYQQSACTLVLGGWGGGVIGLSSLDGYDASENETTTYHTFKNDQWYKVRLQVTLEKIQAWLDDEQVVDVEVGEKKISTRIEVSLSEPLGLATFETTARIKDLQVTPLSPPVTE